MTKTLAIALIWMAMACASSPKHSKTAKQRYITHAAQRKELLTTSGLDQKPEHTDMLGERMREVTAAHTLQGFKRIGEEIRGFLAAGGSTSHRITIAKGKCISVVAIGSAGVRDLDATLFTPDGQALAEDAEPDSSPTVEYCAEETPTIAYFSLRCYEGAGSYALVQFEGNATATLSDTNPQAQERVSAKKHQPGAEPVKERTTDPRMRELSQGLIARGFSTERSFESFMLDRGQRVRVPMETQAARCYTVAAFASSGIEDLNVRVLDSQGVEVASDTSGAADSAVQFCTESKSNASIELTSERGKGRVLLGFFSGKTSDIGGGGNLWLGIRSASRLSSTPLVEAWARDVKSAQDAGFRHPTVLHESQLPFGGVQTHVMFLGQNRCTLLVATGGPGLGAVTLRVRSKKDAVLGEDVSRAPSASVVVCAERRTEVSVDLVAEHGSGAYRLTAVSRPHRKSH